MRVTSLAFHPDNTLLAVASVEVVPTRARSITRVSPYRLYSTSDWSEVALQNAKKTRDLVYSAQGVLAMVVEPETPRTPTTIVKVQSGDEKVLGGSAGCRSLTFIEDELLAACPNGAVSFDADGEPSTLAPGQFSQVVKVAGEDVFVGRGIIVRAFKDGDESIRLPGTVTAMAGSPKSEWLATGDKAGTVSFWRIQRATVPARLYEGHPADLAFSRDEKWLAVAEKDGGFKIFNVASRRLEASGKLPTELIHPQFSPDDSLLALLGTSDLFLIKTSDWTVLNRISATDSRKDEMGVTFTDNNTLLVAEAGRLRRFRLRPNLNELPSIRLSPNETLFVSADRQWMAARTESSPNDTFRFWNASSGALVPANAIPGGLGEPEKEQDTRPGKLPNWIRLFPDPDVPNLSGDRFGGNWVIEGSSISPKAGGSPVVEFNLDVNSYAFSKDGNWIGVADDSTVYLMPWSLDGLINRACELLPRNLTPAEWKNFEMDKLIGPYRKTCPNLPLP